MILATMTDGKADLAEALMLIAFIVFVVAAVLFWIIPAHRAPRMLSAAGLACMALAFFVT
jgi:hypothetical protein